MIVAIGRTFDVQLVPRNVRFQLDTCPPASVGNGKDPPICDIGFGRQVLDHGRWRHRRMRLSRLARGNMTTVTPMSVVGLEIAVETPLE